MPRPRVSIVPVVIVVVIRGDEFLFIQETDRYQRTWYLPGGAVDPGEGLIEAAIRETKEEAGIDVIPRTLLWMEDETYLEQDGSWRGGWRFIIRADPRDPEQLPKATGDTLDARWFTLAQIRELPLRSPEAFRICRAVSRAHPEIPLSYVYRRIE